VAKSKPEPDTVSTALAKVEGASGTMVRDSIFDTRAVAKLEIPPGVRTLVIALRSATDGLR
jgi:hypothetical protein